ncbi:MAG TPA: acyltransferase [Micromonosporaceae bacterium]|nr:acyltransferase [Micromonosporaceae bacterium]
MLPQEARTTRVRLGWLDALRGIAVLLVIYEHVSWHVLRALRGYTQPWFDAGRTGVFLFFIISGYIVPASLERRGSLRGFWFSRIFRLYPMIVVGTGAALLLAVTGTSPVDPVATQKTAATAMASATMLQDLLSLPSTPAVLWSLSYEMIFYLTISALFVFRLHRLSAQWAVLFGGVAAVLGGVLPVATIAELGLGPRTAAGLVLVGMVTGLAGLMSGRRAAVIAGAAVVGGLAATLLVTTTRFPAWYPLSILAAMFAGTTAYRAERGEIRWRWAGPAIVAVALLTVASGLPDLRWATVRAGAAWAGSLALAGALFALGMSLRHRRFPRPLVWVGLISYSVYVLHYVLVLWLGPYLDRHGADRWPVQALFAAGFVALVLAVSGLSYRLVELPMQAFGRRVAAAVDRLLGPDVPVPPAPTAPIPRPQAAPDGRVATAGQLG